MFRIFIEAHEAQSFNMFPWNEGLLIVYCEQNPRFYHEVDGTFYAGAWEKQGIWREQSRGLKEIHVVKCGGISRVSQE